MSLTFELSGNAQTVFATKREGSMELGVSFSKSRLQLPTYIPDPDQSPTQQISAESAYYRELSSSHATHPVLAFIMSLPTPMLLGLDRRSRSEDDFGRRFVQIRNTKAHKNIFSNSLSASVRAAARLAEEGRRSALIAAGRLAEDLQREILLGLLELDVDSMAMYPTLSAPTSKDVAEIDVFRRLLNTLPQVLNVSKEDVSSRILPLFDKLQNYIADIPVDKSVDQLMEKERKPEIIRALMGWSSSQHQLRRIRNLQAIISRYNRRRDSFLDDSKKYLKIVNAFVKDSFKELVFDEAGNLGVKIVGLEGPPRDVASLSSGEAQIFVILTQLSFNKLAASDNVFIIDEPELSLHVDWQEIFVYSIRAANPDVQFILASHSPSIILDRHSKCVDISRVKPKVVKQ